MRVKTSPKEVVEVVLYDDEFDNGIVDDGVETLMFHRCLVTPRELEEDPEIEEIKNINGDENQSLMIRHDPLVLATGKY